MKIKKTSTALLAFLCTSINANAAVSFKTDPNSQICKNSTVWLEVTGDVDEPTSACCDTSGNTGTWNQQGNKTYTWSGSLNSTANSNKQSIDASDLGDVSGSVEISQTFVCSATLATETLKETLTFSSEVTPTHTSTLKSGVDLTGNSTGSTIEQGAAANIRLTGSFSIDVERCSNSPLDPMPVEVLANATAPGSSQFSVSGTTTTSGAASGSTPYTGTISNVLIDVGYVSAGNYTVNLDANTKVAGNTDTVATGTKELTIN
ncbi:hypothetical protein [Cerasicoccus arenae]|uniref:Ig-like domain-containing protein n=1 Tax=Cerasicoccus arenae TaxID=424488 RepID=A0A8J3GES1_9BACT|nr:hypothetical protein [Cerasicoccus arenae]MBK1857845.1 hypothetical protein [Cerasicoccus arenae]GHC11524.1 hypothetical protein GCM10007047_30980 [Cerasicoccus arenae]